MTKRDNLSESELEALFAAAQDEVPRPSAALIGRILADAEMVRAPWWRRISIAVGGWPAMAGLAAATVAGVWIGVAAPDAINSVTSGYWGDTYDFSAFSPELSTILAEG